MSPALQADSLPLSHQWSLMWDTKSFMSYLRPTSWASFFTALVTFSFENNSQSPSVSLLAQCHSPISGHHNVSHGLLQQPLNWSLHSKPLLVPNHFSNCDFYKCSSVIYWEFHVAHWPIEKLPSALSSSSATHQKETKGIFPFVRKSR